jgi:hypothetical protein
MPTTRPDDDPNDYGTCHLCGEWRPDWGWKCDCEDTTQQHMQVCSEEMQAVTDTFLDERVDDEDAT